MNPGIQKPHKPSVRLTSGVLFGKPTKAWPPQMKYRVPKPKKPVATATKGELANVNTFSAMMASLSEMAIARFIPVNRRVDREPRAQQIHSLNGLWFSYYLHVGPSKYGRGISLSTLGLRCALPLSAKLGKGRGRVWRSECNQSR